ncbi:MAG TPA: penicillin-binding protein 2 [Acidimicrobiales bacterium]|nr:penicillin-binding protein 2 [Acidimicrobiales bacterium]
MARRVTSRRATSRRATSRRATGVAIRPVVRTLEEGHPGARRNGPRRGYERRLSAPTPLPTRPKVTGPVPRRRLGIIRIMVVVVFAVIAVRLVMVQGLSGSHYSSISAAQVTSVVQVPAVRGGIFDRDGAVLATSVPRTTIVADPFIIKHPKAEAAALSPALGLSQRILRKDLTEDSGFVYLAKKVGNAEATRVNKLNLVGINLLPDTERVDPAGNLAMPVVGAVGAEGSGQGGLEYQYNSLLGGRSGTEKVEQALSGVTLPGGTTQLSPSTAGTSIELTLDEPLQYVAEQALGAEIETSHAKSGSVIVMNTHTGDILAMANLVADPTTGQAVEAPSNLALTQVYEPGSVFKLAPFSAALQDGIITPSQVFTVPNSLNIANWVFHDAESHPTEQLSATQILAQSSNIGTIEIAQLLGKTRLAKQIQALGFGQPTGLDFPAESAGLVKSDASTWNGSDIGSTPIGQDDAVTAQQVLDMVNTVATGGVYVPPRLVEATIADDGTLHQTPRRATHRALSTVVTSELTTMMEQVVQDGTAVAAGVPGYNVAGKTGTAQVPDPVHGGYIPGAYMATFAGFAPAENPALSTIVVLNRPEPIYGGVVAAPVFSEVMQYALHRYGIPTSPGGGTTGGKPSAVAFPPPPSVAASTPPATTTAQVTVGGATAPKAKETAVPTTAGTIIAAVRRATEGP